MPESPEVKLTTEYLNETLTDCIITSWDIIKGKYLEIGAPGFENFEMNLPMLVESVKCKGKFIYFTLYNEDGMIYIMHSLRLTGRWQNIEDEYTHWCVSYDNPKKNLVNEKIWFRNPRGLATMECTSDERILNNYVNGLGPDILTDEFSLPIWKNLVQQYSGKNITAFLMNQNILSGIGNYIKAEALYAAKISPLRKTGSLTESESAKLYEAIRIIPRISYNNKGLSLRDYADADGNDGYYSDHLRIYGKKSATKTKTPDGRITYWCKDTQK